MLCQLLADMKIYSLLLQLIFLPAQKGIDKYRCVSFPNVAGVDDGDFLQLSGMCMSSTYVYWEAEPHIQRSGICIALVVGDLVSPELGSQVERLLADSG